MFCSSSHCEEDLVIFEILAENLKCELDKILKANHQYKTDYYRFNRKKFLLSYCFDPNNVNNEYEINAYLDEIKKISSYKDYSSCFERAKGLISSTITFVQFKSNKLLEKLKLNNHEKNLNQHHHLNNQYNTVNNFNVQHQILPTAPKLPTSTINILNRNTNNLETITLDSDSYVTTEIANTFVQNLQSLAQNLENESFNQTITPHQAISVPMNQERARVRQEKNVRHQFKCPECDKVFRFKQNLSRHINLHTGAKPFICEYCARQFRDASALVVHVKIKHKDRSNLPHACDICNKRFCNKSSRDAHVLLHNTDRKFMCDKCGNSFRTEFYLKRHETIHSGQKPFECSICSKKFRLHQILKMHMQSHVNERSHKCLVCDKLFKTRDALNKHKKIHLAPEERNFPCLKCDKKFATQGRLNVHMTAHISELNFECNVCKKKFKSSRSLKEHSLIHTEPTFKCDKCESRFFQRSKLKRHSVIHLNVKTHPCSFCKKRFKTIKTLNDHKRAKHDDKVNLSELENEKEREKTEKTRTNSIENEERFSCPSCTKTFSQKKHLYDHKRIHSGNNKCPICGKIVHKLKRHMTIHKKSEIQNLNEKTGADNESLNISTKNKETKSLRSKSKVNKNARKSSHPQKVIEHIFNDSE